MECGTGQTLQMNTTTPAPRKAMGALSLLAVVLVFGALSRVHAQLAQIAHFVSPPYPALARQAMISGQVTLKAAVDKEGSITAVSEESSAHPLLAQEAKASVKEWRFQSASRDRTISVIFYYGFSGTTKEFNPITTVKADFAGSTVRVFITTDASPTVRQ